MAVIKNWGWTKRHEDWCTEAMRRLSDNLKHCSCAACGNPRRFWKDRLTMQEKKAWGFKDYE